MKKVWHHTKKTKKTAFTCGCFDLLHANHVKLLELAKQQADYLLVALNSDASIKRLKGDKRPVIKQEQREYLIRSLKYVDDVIVFDEESPKGLISKLKPDVYVKGGDYTIDTINQEERKIVESYGGKIELIKVNNDISTGKIIEDIVGKWEPEIDSHKLLYHPDRVNEWLTNKDCYPLYIEMGLTDKCNQSCKFCALDFIERKGISLNTKIVNKTLSELTGKLKSIMFAGEGEPLLHKDIGNFAFTSKICGIDTSITTNGMSLDERKREELLPYLSWIRVSIDSGTPDNYAYMHGTQPDKFNLVMKNLEDAVELKRKNKLPVTIGTQFLVTPYNKDEARILARKLRDIGVDNLQIKPYSHHPKSKNNFVIEPEIYNSLEQSLSSFNNNEFKVLFRKATLKRIQEGNAYNKCYSLPFFALIEANGNVLPCNLYHDNKDYTYGNLYKNTFKEIWESKQRKDVLNRIEKDGVSNCRHGCRLDVTNRYLNRIVNKEAHDNFI